MPTCITDEWSSKDQPSINHTNHKITMLFPRFLKFFDILYVLFVLLPVRARLEQVCTPNQPTSWGLTGPFSTCFDSVKEGLIQRHPDQTKNTPQVLQKYGYPFQTYNVITKDGYILTVYRVTGSPKLRKKSKGMRQAVYLNHGLGGAFNTWNFQPKSRNLPFKLADAGYEVWLANGRGTALSLKHTKYDSVTDLRYWNFSFHEMGMYDVPAVTNKILLETNTRKIFYIGHGMATTQYFVGLSELSEMNDKIAAAQNPIRYFARAYAYTSLSFCVFVVGYLSFVASCIRNQ